MARVFTSLCIYVMVVTVEISSGNTLFLDVVVADAMQTGVLKKRIDSPIGTKRLLLFFLLLPGIRNDSCRLVDCLRCFGHQHTSADKSTYPVKGYYQVPHNVEHFCLFHSTLLRQLDRCVLLLYHQIIVAASPHLHTSRIIVALMIVFGKLCVVRL